MNEEEFQNVELVDGEWEQDLAEAEQRAARLEEALRELTGKRITDAEGWATWAKNVARRALAHEEDA